MSGDSWICRRPGNEESISMCRSRCACILILQALDHRERRPQRHSAEADANESQATRRISRPRTAGGVHENAWTTTSSIINNTHMTTHCRLAEAIEREKKISLALALSICTYIFVLYFSLYSLIINNNNVHQYSTFRHMMCVMFKSLLAYCAS
jgi:hypothetical protein